MFYFEAIFSIFIDEYNEDCRMIQVDTIGLDRSDYEMCDVWSSAITQVHTILEKEYGDGWELSKIELVAS